MPCVIKGWYIISGMEERGLHKLFIAKVLLDKKLMGVKMYERYEHALSDTIDKESDLYSCLPEESLMDFSMPKIFTASVDTLEYGVDFEYRYTNGVTVCIEEVVTEEAVRNSRHALDRSGD